MSMGKVLIAAVGGCIVALFANAHWVDSQTRAAEPRDGGYVVNTRINAEIGTNSNTKIDASADANVIGANVSVEGTGPAIVLIHGFGAAMDWWDGIAPDLAVDHRIIRVDLIGHGGTEAPRYGYSIERQGALVSAILDQLGINRVTVIGHSMGGEVATALAEIEPGRIERMILIDSPPTAGADFTVMTEAYLNPILGQLLSHFESDEAIRQGLAQGFAPGFVVPEKFVADLKQLTYTAFRSAHEESIAYRESKLPYERIAALKPVPPLLAIFGTRDAIVPPENAKFFARVPGAKIVMIEGAGHSPMVESPEETLELIRRFLPPATSVAPHAAD